MSWEKNVRRVVPYTPGEQPRGERIIKLNTNENPYPPSAAVLPSLIDIGKGEFRRYPDPKAGDLVEAIAETYGLTKKQVFVGVGSDDVLAMLFLTFFNGGKPVLFPDVTYSFYEVWCDLFRIPYTAKPLDENFHIRTEDYLSPNGGIVLANPNAPTGSLLPLSEIERIVSANADSVVIVDEAYIDFGGESALPLIDKYENLVVVQTFSKSRSMAGLRVGYAMGSERLIRFLQDAKYSFNSYTLSTPIIRAAAAAMRDTEHFQQNCQKIVRTRGRAERRFRELGFCFEESAANFLFVTHPLLPARQIFEYLRGRGIYVRWFDRDRIRNYLRVTIGTDEEMQEFFEVLEGYVYKVRSYGAGEETSC